MSRSSTIYTIGTALNRAHDSGAAVQVLVEGMWVEGMWVEGQIVALDGFGVVIEASPEEHSVIRVESITAVTIRTRAPQREQIPEQAYAMPGARGAN